jgi:hypothetical protein
VAVGNPAKAISYLSEPWRIFFPSNLLDILYCIEGEVDSNRKFFKDAFPVAEIVAIGFKQFQAVRGWPDLLH